MYIMYLFQYCVNGQGHFILSSKIHPKARVCHEPSQHTLDPRLLNFASGPQISYMDC